MLGMILKNGARICQLQAILGRFWSVSTNLGLEMVEANNPLKAWERTPKRCTLPACAFVALLLAVCQSIRFCLCACLFDCETPGLETGNPQFS